ncbi:glycerophosphodiester phosphodiesterase family protein [Aurantiacibacter suaedae]|uniref:glycerophosphodiester phosphodiesterase family protein n=1 Tax=Aurantiacibacter suaedae TaxID=2545755 RepID=UPI003BAAB8C8
MAGRTGVKWLACLAALLLTAPAVAQDSDMLIIAHRGASGDLPEHTLAAYEKAIDDGADYIEMDLVATKDGVLVARHENEIGGTTDIDLRPEFASRLTTRIIDGAEQTGWFTEDLTLAELKTLRAKERLPELRPASAAHDGDYAVPTFAEVLALVKRKEAETGRKIGIYPEIKHPAYFAGIGYDLAAMLLAELETAGMRPGVDPVFIQCFEVTPLVRLNQLTAFPLIQLVAPISGPADVAGRTYAQMLDDDGLAMIATYAEGIGPAISQVLKPDGTPTGLVAAAHARSLAVHPWTMRHENAFLPPALRMGDDPAGVGDAAKLWSVLVAAGIDGLFTDHAGEAVRLRAAN